MLRSTIKADEWRVSTDYLNERPTEPGHREANGPLWRSRVPCSGCINEQRCADAQLACAAFKAFVFSGRRVAPSEPTREIFDKMYSEGDDP